MANNSEIEFSPTPSIKSLKSRFEQLAFDSAPSTPAPSTFTKSAATAASPIPSQSYLVPTSSPRNSRTRALWTPDDRDRDQAQSPPTIRVVPTDSTPDSKGAALKRAPPPPPPSRVKKSSTSPIASPLLRPVPVPPTLMASSAGADHEPSVSRSDQLNTGLDENIEDSSPRLGGVSSLRNMFSAATQVRASTLSPSRPTTPKPPSRPHMLTSNSDSVVGADHLLPTLPPRHAKLGSIDPASPPIVDSPTEMSTPSIVTVEASPRAGTVATIRNRFSTLDVPASQISKVYLREDHHTFQSEPNILSSSPPALPARNLHLRPQSSSLFSRDDSSEFQGSPASSLNSPFSDDESEISEISEVSLQPVASSRKLNGSFEAIPSSIYANGPYAPRPQRKFSDSSSESVSNLSPPTKPKPPPRPALQAPPRPPRRTSGAPAHSGPKDPSSASSTMATPTPLAPPPLPSRRSTQEEATLAIMSPTPAPPLPARSLTPQHNSQTSLEPVSPTGDRKPLGNNKLQPPPTRTIGLGDKLPPMRRPPSPSSDESGSEEDPRARAAESLPDSSHSSRRPPHARSTFLDSKIQVPAHSGHVIVAGPNAVVATHHHVKGFDLSSHDVSYWTLDTRDCMRGCVVTCLEFRSASRDEDKGKLVWVGTKDGHLFEVDVRNGAPSATKLGVHGSHITNIFRHGATMITVDDSGKVLVFDPNANASGGVGAGLADDVSLVYTAPRVYRIGEKADFVKLLGGLLWTAARTETHGAVGASAPVVRIYDVFTPGSTARSVTPTQHVGAVTSGTILQSHPDHVYLGHEGGYITIWNVATNDGMPVCVDVSKVSTSDVLCLEGVHDRLWAGGRNGTISAYDVSAKPWVVTNCWDAHGGLPVMKIFVDPFSIHDLGWLNVISVGRDEHIRSWDGLLGADRIDQELLKREHTFSTFRDIKVLVVSWNVDAAKPDALGTDPENLRFLHHVLTSVDSPDIISFGFQELIDLESRKMAAKTVLLGGKKKGEEGKLNEKVTSSYKRWHDRLVQAVKQAMPISCPYTVIHTESLVGLFMCVFVKNTERVALKDAAIATVKRGMGGRYGNKGGIVARFVIDDSSLCFINCHLAAGQHHVRQRNADVAAFLEEKNLFPSDPGEEDVGFVGGGDGSMVLDHEIVFLNGDMNYRIDQRRDVVIAAIQSGDLDSLHTHDQLLKEMNHNRAFRLRQFTEGPLSFPPTYKYDRHSHEFDTSEKRRVPAWCDRVLWRSRDPGRVVQLNYRRYEPNVSDHRPVSAAFRVTVKKVRGEAREREKRVLEGWWLGTQNKLLAGANEFYRQQALL